MALSYSTTVDKALVSGRMDNGLRIQAVEITIGATGDYSSGLTVVGSKFGMNKIMNVLDANIRGSTGAITDRFHHWDQTTDKLRFYDLSTTAEVVASDLAANDVVNAVFLGY